MKIIFCFLLLLMISSITNAQQSATNTVSNPKSSTQQVYAVGKVLKPATIPFQEPITLLQAIRHAGGTVLSEKKSRAIITRVPPNCEFQTVIVIELRDILAKRVDDLMLQSNDVINVKAPLGKAKYNITPIPCRIPQIPSAL